MNRKVLLVEPNYKNKYPPMGLMKIAMYYRMKGDDVRFFKGDLKDLGAQLILEDLLENLDKYNPNMYWKQYAQEFFDFIRKGKKDVFESKEIVDDEIVVSLVKEAKKDYRRKSYFENPQFDRVGITTLFTFYWDITIETINFVKQLCKTPDGVMVGGIAASILPDQMEKATGIRPWVGQLSHPGDLDPGDDLIVDELPLDYSILDEIDYKYPASNAYFAYMTRGCINHCSFCAVPKLEPEYKGFISLESRIQHTIYRFGEMRNLLLLDNNVFASEQFNEIIDKIKEYGFQKGAKYMPPNQYKIAIRNLKDNYNNRAYIRKIIDLYKDLMEKIPGDLKTTFYNMLEENYCLSYMTANREAILKLDDFVAPLYEKYLAPKRKVKRIVDFNQGLDSRLVTDEIMSKLSEICIDPTRIAFDHWELRDVYEKAIRTAARNGITKLSNYLLYNYMDKPEHLYFRMKMNVDLCNELGINIYSFPMKYHPIDDPEYFSNRNYIGKYWNRKFIRTIQCVLNSTKGKVGKGKEFFDEAFGANVDEFETLLWMPELFIIYRSEFKYNLTQEWKTAFYSLDEPDLDRAKQIISKNKFKGEIDFSSENKQVQKVLFYYMLDKRSAEDYLKKNNEIS